ncbi:acyltransferase family protein [Streptomyces sp. AA1529]|uniref:acyltransferase family protein n=1 Tax=Streptomyces sp. AA1529 TaxID=1203257 RepID=UPI003D721F17
MAWDPFTDSFVTPSRTAPGGAEPQRTAPPDGEAAARSAPTVSALGSCAGPDGSGGTLPGPPGPAAGLPAPAPAPPSSGTRRPGERGAPDEARGAREGDTGGPEKAAGEPHRRWARGSHRPARGASAAARQSGRDPFLDNARFLLVLLVVLEHNWAPVADAMRGVEAASLLVYSFHLPALALLCGHLSRNFTGRPDQMRRLLTHLLVPYLVFEAAFGGMRTLFWEQPFAVTPTRPSFVCWFLLALFVWRLTAPLWRAVRWPVAFAALLSVAAGFTDLGDELALSRLLMYWPWFVLGLRLRADRLRPLRNRAARRWALPVLAAAAAGAWWAAPRVSRDWLLMEAGAHELGLRPLPYVGVRLALFVLGGVLVAAFLALVPARRTGYTVLGACALYPFLLHGLVVEAVRQTGGYQVVVTGGLLAVVGTTVLAVGLTMLLGLPQVRQVLWPLVEPSFPGWLHGRAAPEAGDTAAPDGRLPRVRAPQGGSGRWPADGRAVAPRSAGTPVPGRTANGG